MRETLLLKKNLKKRQKRMKFERPEKNSDTISLVIKHLTEVVALWRFWRGI